MKRCIGIIMLLTIAPLFSMAQKAYETVNYSGKVNGQTISLALANGYIAASQISLIKSAKSKAVIYTPESGTPGTDQKLTFKSTQAGAGYFIMNDMQNAYDTAPAAITGIFLIGNKSSSFKLTLNKGNI